VRETAVLAGLALACCLSVADVQAAGAAVSNGTSGGPAGAASAGGTPTCTPWTPGNKTTLRDGGYLQDFSNDGVTAQFSVPPASFVPLAASDAQLAEYGFPARPTNAADLATWHANMAAWSGAMPPAPCTLSGYKAAWGVPDENWAGVDATSSSNTYIAVQGNFVQPTFQTSTCDNTAETSWVGLGGSGAGHPLLQAGTFAPLGGGSPYMFWEYVTSGGGGNGVSVFNPSYNVSPGDSMYQSVTYRQSDGNTTFYVADNSQSGHSGVVNIKLPGDWDGTTAEFVDERPSYGTSYMNLSKFSTITWSGAQAENTAGTWNWVGNISHNGFAMYNHTYTTLLADPDNGLTTSSSWTDYFHNCWGGQL
jgi:hypothetical protein